MIIRIFFFLLFSLFLNPAFNQTDSTVKKFSHEADFRFRIEQDWNSRKSDGSLREDRSRLRYRARIGTYYQLQEKYSFGLRIRTGNPSKQQDPQLTLGEGAEEFGTLPIGFEKAFLKYEENGINFWLGKNTFPFKKNNELFWSDNVFPEGVFIEKSFPIANKTINQIDLRGGHFIVEANGSSFEKDSYLNSFQTVFSFLNDGLIVFPSFYNFNNISNIPDDNGSYDLNYSILHLGGQITLSKAFTFEFDYYNNLQNYSKNDSIQKSLAKEKEGFTSSLSYGHLKEKKDWFLKITYAYLERFSAVDFLSQNDWARWDYSSSNSPDGRLTNMQGIELVASYLIEDDLKFTCKFYQVEQIVALGTTKETGSRIRFDLDITF